MPNLSFGQNSDPSSFFGGLSRNYLLDQEALLRDAADRNRDVQDAQDKDTFDKWKNGMISDDEWLAYIARRVEETKGDSKQNQSWVELQREYTVAIADDKAEFQYQNGEITIHQLIAYYEGRRKGLNKDSQEWREVTLRINEYVDKAASDDIQAGAQDIADRIAVGSATLQDLKAYYQSKLGGLRKNSPLYEQISAEIRDIQSQIVAGGYSGGGGRSRYSSGGGNGGLSSAEAYDLSTSSGFIQADSVLREHAQRNSLGVSAEARAFSGFIPGMSESDTNEFLAANSRYYESILDQWKDSDTAIDPTTGEVIPGDPDTRRAVAYQLIDSYEMQAIANETGDTVNADFAMGRRDAQVQAILNYIQPANAMDFETDVVPILERVMNSDMYAIEQSGNFGAAPVFAATQAQRWQTALNRATKKRTRFLEGADDSPYGEKFGGDKPLTDQLPTGTVQYIQTIIDGLNEAAKGDFNSLEQWRLQAADSSGPRMDWLVGPEGTLAKLASAHQTNQALVEGTAELVYSPEDQELNGGNGLVAVSRYSVRPELGEVTPELNWNDAKIAYDPDKGDREVTIWVDGPNGKPIPVRTLARVGFVPGWSALIDTTTNEYLSEESIRSIGTPDDVQRLIEDGSLERVPAGQYLSVRYIRNGREIRMYQDERTGGWSGRPPFSLESQVMTGIVGVSPSGQLPKRSRPFSHTRQVPVPYFGSDPEQFQRMIDRGEVPDAFMMFIGPDGQPTGDFAETDGLYFDDAFQKKGYSYADPELADFRREKSVRTWQTRSGMLEGSEMENPQDDATGRTFGGGWGPSGLPEQMFSGLKDMLGSVGVFFGDYYGGNRPVWKPFASDKAGSELSKLSLTEKYANFRPAPGEVRRANAARASADALPKVTLPKPNAKATTTLAKLPSVTTRRIVSRETLARRAGIVPTQKAPVALPKAPVSAPAKTTSTIAKTPTTVVRRPAYKTPSRY